MTVIEKPQKRKAKSRSTDSNQPSGKGPGTATKGKQSRAKDPGKPAATTQEPQTDPEFAAYLPAHRPEEIAELEARLKAAGGGAIVTVWKDHGIILDGHHGYAISKRLGLKFEVRYVDLPNRAAALRWIRENQTGRRNLTDLASRYFRGLDYLANKRQGQRNDLATSGNDCRKSETVTRSIDKNGVCERTLRNDAELVKAIDALTAKKGDRVRLFLLSPKEPLTGKDIVDLAGLPTEKQDAIVDLLLAGKSFAEASGRPARPPKSGGGGRAHKGSPSPSGPKPGPSAPQENHPSNPQHLKSEEPPAPVPPNQEKLGDETPRVPESEQEDDPPLPQPNPANVLNKAQRFLALKDDLKEIAAAFESYDFCRAWSDAIDPVVREELSRGLQEIQDSLMVFHLHIK